MKFFLTAVVLMMMLQGCSEDDNGVVTTGDVTVEDVQVEVSEEVSVTDAVDSTEDVATVEEGD